MASHADGQEWATARAGNNGQVRPTAPSAERHLYGPVADWLLLGGSSLFILPLLTLLPSQRWQATVALTMMVLANFINHPHFAHSYQIFYRDFRAKLTGGERMMRWRYAGAGILAPLLLLVYFTIGLWRADLRMVGLGFNIMGLFVGWHYVKQGYGMLMVDAALKRRFFSEEDKRLLLINAYAVWVFAWIKLNGAAQGSEYWGVRTISLAVPHWLTLTSALVAGASGLTVLTMLAKRLRSGAKLPVAGLTAYGVTLYVWTAFGTANPLVFLVIPALHSIQYLAVVYRFQSSVAHAAEPVRPGRALARFGLTGVLLGAMLFWVLPIALSARFAYRPELFGATLFVFVGWISINVHHYFMDSVMWRRGNPETSRHLFGR
ncbi:hypothetical protein OMW55_04245 [Sphingomonas sp. BN140010]|uniref:Beta-carotene 15,15'-monooxygenase n=1 Tax=Sphingomonas arvum TaxID=2992113 RepID=A0ABT3JDN5_9SPHN|nr:hypothetical protein [Sphingomonas sp. BN140010]MCW3797014.1 hypothetical protein [Sphingomonas sp. BN140010]